MMIIVDNPAASSAAASAAPATPLDGIELQPERAAESRSDASAEAAPGRPPNTLPEATPEQPPNASPEAVHERQPDAPAEASGSADAPNSASSAPAVGEDAPAAAPVLEASAEQSAQKQRGRQFKPGQSGNLNGRPKGARNHATRLVEALIDGQSEALGAKAVEMALQGDSSMLRALLSTLVPPRRERKVESDLPRIEDRERS